MAFVVSTFFVRFLCAVIVCASVHVTRIFAVADVSCSWTAYDGRLSCPGITSEIDLGHAVRKYEKLNIEEFELVNSELRFISHDVFLGTKVQRITLKDSALMSLSDTSTAFEGLDDHLQYLKVLHCTLVNRWNWRQLSNLRNLYTIEVRQSDLDYVSEFPDIPVTFINLPYNGITEISPTAFSKVHSVFGLNLNNNQITTLKRSSFPNPASKLTTINLSFNQIRYLPQDIFKDMPRLLDLYLQNNQIRTIDELVFKPVWKRLVLFTFQGNQLTCDCRLKWLVKIGVPTRFLIADCDSPRELRGKSIRDLRINDLWC